jgi:hypothetical protein
VYRKKLCIWNGGSIEHYVNTFSFCFIKCLPIYELPVHFRSEITKEDRPHFLMQIVLYGSKYQTDSPKEHKYQINWKSVDETQCMML